MKTFFDDLGRTIWTAENYHNFDPTNLSTISDGTDASRDRITKSEYNGTSREVRVIAYNGSSTATEETRYLFEDSVDASRATNVIYPDSSDADSTGTDQVKTTHAVDGLPTQRRDQRGTVIAYSYDALRRSQSEKVTSLGGADGFVRSITRKYDTLGRGIKVTSHGNQTDDPDNTSNIRNQIALTYDDLGRVIKSQQSHSGAVTGSTPDVEYTFDLTASSSVFTNGARLETAVYPDGRVIYYDYGAADALEDRLSMPKRLRETNSSGTILVEYSRTGSGNVVITDYPQPDLKLDLFGGTSSTYAGMDRFGRTIDHRWYSYASGTVDVARFAYGYDDAGNRLWKEDSVAAGAAVNQDELYAFDGLNRLKAIDRGNLTTGNTVIASAIFGQDFGLDQLNNWPTFNEDTDGNGVDNIVQTRTHNEANEITHINGSTSRVAHNAAGDMTRVPLPTSWGAHNGLTWDAWNRLVRVGLAGNDVAEYEYDGQNRRIVKKIYNAGSLSQTRHMYLSEQNQVLEERVDASTDPDRQFTWGTQYVDELILRTRDTDANGTLDETVYALQDASWNTVALSNAGGTILERFRYDPYGRSTVLDANFANDSDGLSDLFWEYRFTSREWDNETGLHYFRARYWHDTLGRFIGRDPLGSVNGVNLYAGYFVPSFVDPLGCVDIRV